MSIENFKYYVPLTSYKSGKSGRMHERIDLKIIKSRGRELAFLQINNMIPVSDNFISEVDFGTLDINYINLLNAELADLRPRKDSILRDAEKVYSLTTKYRSDNEQLTRRCYDFKLLETKLEEYSKIQL